MCFCKRQPPLAARDQRQVVMVIHLCAGCRCWSRAASCVTPRRGLHLRKRRACSYPKRCRCEGTDIYVTNAVAPSRPHASYRAWKCWRGAGPKGSRNAREQFLSHTLLCGAEARHMPRLGTDVSARGGLVLLTLGAGAQACHRHEAQRSRGAGQPDAAPAPIGQGGLRYVLLASLAKFEPVLLQHE